MKTTLVAAAALLGACTTMTDVVPTGKDTFMVGTSVRGGLTSDTEVKAGAITRANEYCSTKGQRAQVLDSKSSGARGWTPQNAEVHFTCIDR